jgi:ABC-2 type transport system ATP-binding protein
MIRVERLSKSFGELSAVDGVDLDVAAGEVFGLLGPNGAGKTTTINMICGVLRPDAGRVLVDGRDIWLEPRAVKGLLGVVPQEITVYEDLTARDNLHFWGSLYGLGGSELTRRVDQALARVGLADRAVGRVSTFSGGMKRRLNLCMGLLHSPKVLLLDEPTVGIDPQARRSILDVIAEVAQAGTTVLYTTHYMEEAQELCDRIAIVDHGRILACGTLAELQQLAGGDHLLVVSGHFAVHEGRERLDRVAGTRILSAADGSVVLALDATGGGLLAVLPEVLGCGLDLADVSIQKPNLESVFLTLTGRELRD